MIEKLIKLTNDREFYQDGNINLISTKSEIGSLNISEFNFVVEDRDMEGCVVGYYFYRNSVISNLESSSKNVEENWKKYTENITLRNEKLILETIKDDTLQHYLKTSKDIEKKKFSREFEYIEYKINENLMSENIETDFNEKLNSNVDVYNQSVREYNVYRVTFPNSLIARKMDYPKSFKYFDIIRYGIENQNPKEKRQKVDNWNKNGGKHPE